MIINENSKVPYDIMWLGSNVCTLNNLTFVASFLTTKQISRELIVNV